LSKDVTYSSDPNELNTKINEYNSAMDYVRTNTQAPSTAISSNDPNKVILESASECNNCQNGGHCAITGDNDYLCTCRQEYAGTNCEVLANAEASFSNRVSSMKSAVTQLSPTEKVRTYQSMYTSSRVKITIKKVDRQDILNDIAGALAGLNSEIIARVKADAARQNTAQSDPEVDNVDPTTSVSTSTSATGSTATAYSAKAIVKSVMDSVTGLMASTNNDAYRYKVDSKYGNTARSYSSTYGQEIAQEQSKSLSTLTSALPALAALADDSGNESTVDSDYGYSWSCKRLNRASNGQYTSKRSVTYNRASGSARMLTSTNGTAEIRVPTSFTASNPDVTLAYGLIKDSAISAFANYDYLSGYGWMYQISFLYTNGSTAAVQSTTTPATITAPCKAPATNYVSVCALVDTTNSVTITERAASYDTASGECTCEFTQAGVYAFMNMPKPGAVNTSSASSIFVSITTLVSVLLAVLMF